MPLTFDLPEDPREIRAWLLDAEAQVAQWVARKVTVIAQEAAERYFASMTASGDLGVWDAVTIYWNQFVTDELVDTFGGMYLNGGVNVWIQAPGTAAISPQMASGWASVVNQGAIDYTQSLAPVWRDTGQRLQERLSTKVAQSLMAGPDPRVLAKDLDDIAREISIRADFLARTELTRAYNGGGFEGAVALGEYGPVEKSWSSGLDDRVRDTHLQADGQFRPVSEPFDVGGEALMFPGDPAGSLAETISCRCTALYWHTGETRPDGSVVESPQSGIFRSEQEQRIIDAIGQEQTRNSLFDDPPL